MKSYKDLKVYTKSYVAAKDIYLLVKGYPQQEQYELASQMRRAATGIPLNIAEGYAKRPGDREWARFLKMARGSCAEMEVLLDFSKDFGYLSEEEYERNKAQYEEIGRMLSGLIKTLIPED